MRRISTRASPRLASGRCNSSAAERFPIRQDDPLAALRLGPGRVRRVVGQLPTGTPPAPLLGRVKQVEVVVPAEPAVVDDRIGGLFAQRGDRLIQPRVRAVVAAHGQPAGRAEPGRIEQCWRKQPASRTARSGRWSPDWPPSPSQPGRSRERPAHTPTGGSAASNDPRAGMSPRSAAPGSRQCRRRGLRQRVLPATLSWDRYLQWCPSL